MNYFQRFLIWFDLRVRKGLCYSIRNNQTIKIWRKQDQKHSITVSNCNSYSDMMETLYEMLGEDLEQNRLPIEKFATLYEATHTECQR